MGLIQTIRLMIDRNSLQQLQRDAASASKTVAETLTKELGDGKSAEQAVLRYATRLRAVFERKTEQMRKDLAKGLISVPDAEKSAKQLADKFTGMLAAQLKNGIGRNLRKEQKARIIDAIVPTSAELAFKYEGEMSKFMARMSTMSSRFRVPSGSTFEYVNVPAARPLSASQDKKLFKEAGGIPVEYRRLVREAMREQQAYNSTLTTAGKIMNAMGFNVYKLSAAYQALNVSTKHAKTSAASFAAQGQPGMAALAGMGNGFRQLGLQMMAALSIYRLFQHAVTSVKQVADTQAVYSRLATTLADFGISTAKAWPEIKRLSDEMASFGYKPTFTAEVLATLIQITGDYSKSLKGVETVLNLVIERHMTWETAARVVGRSIIGDIGNIQRHGIFLDKTKDSLDQLILRFGGAARNQALTLKGVIDRLSVAYWQLNQTMGETIVAGMKNGRVFDTMAVTMGMLQETLKNSGALFTVLITLGNALLMIFTGLLFVLNGWGLILDKVFKLVGTVVDVFIYAAGEIPDQWTAMWRSMYAVALDTAELIANVVKTMTNGIIDTTKAIQDLKKENNAAYAAASGRSRTRTDAFTSDFGQSVRNFLDVPTDDSGNPMKDLPVGTAGHIRAREEEQITARILQLRRLANSEDEERSERALEDIEKVYEAQQKRLREIEETDPTNQLKKDKVNEHLERIDDLRAEMEKKRNAKQKKDTAENTRLALLARVALLDKDKESLEALAELANMERKYADERTRTTVMSERYFVLTDRLLKIEKIRKDVANRRNEELNVEIESLGQNVELGVDQEASLARLNALQTERMAKLEEEEVLARQIRAMSPSPEREELINRSLERRKIIAQQLLDIAASISNEDDKVSTRIAQYKEWLKVAETREIAEARLVALRKVLQDRIANEAMSVARMAKVAAQLGEVSEALGERFNLRSTARAVTSLDEMLKNGMNRQEVLRMSIIMQDEMNSAMERGNILLEEQAQVLALLERLRRKILDLQKPELDFWKDLEYTMKTMLVPTIENTMKSMADVVVEQFGRMTSAMSEFTAGNALLALASIPKSMAAAVTDAVRQIAATRVKEHMAEALSATAQGLNAAAWGDVRGSMLFFRSAGTHMLAAAKWGLLGGAAGSATNGLMGGGSNGSSGRGAKADKQAGPEINLYIDGIDPSNARHQALVGNTVQQYEERYGVRVNMKANTGR